MIAFDPFVANLIKTRGQQQTDGPLIALTRQSTKSNVASKIPAKRQRRNWEYRRKPWQRSVHLAAAA
ncbi:MAG: hypothetical protein ACLP6G_16120 [Terriglobales bacterium]